MVSFVCCSLCLPVTKQRPGPAPVPDNILEPASGARVGGVRLNKEFEMNLVVKSFLAGAAAMAAVACNTVEGFGEDVEKVGDQIEETANEAR